MASREKREQTAKARKEREAMKAKKKKEREEKLRKKGERLTKNQPKISGWFRKEGSQCSQFFIRVHFCKKTGERQALF